MCLSQQQLCPDAALNSITFECLNEDGKQNTHCHVLPILILQQEERHGTGKEIDKASASTSASDA